MSTVLAICLGMITAASNDRTTVVIVEGAAGEPEYAKQFHAWSDSWNAAATKAGAEVIRIGSDDPASKSDRDRLQHVLSEKSDSSKEPLWLVLIGHGTYDGREAKYNFRGPDVTDVELAKWLGPIKRPLAVLDCTSASGTFINRLSGNNRVVITATKSGNETNYARFGQYLAEAIGDPRADLDKDQQVSLLEAYLTANARVQEYYRTHAQLATEHALLDDNGDHLGTPADWFRGVHATKRAKDGAQPDGIRANQFHLIRSDRERQIPPEVRRRRDELELSVAALRDEKEKLPESEYYARLEKLMTELARIYRDLPTQAGPGHSH